MPEDRHESLAHWHNLPTPSILRLIHDSVDLARHIPPANEQAHCHVAADKKLLKLNFFCKKSTTWREGTRRLKSRWAASTPPHGRR